MKAFILAGGFATRLWPLTSTRAKPMLLINRQPILGHILAQIPPEVEIFLLTNSRFEPDFLAYLKTVDRPVQIFCEDAHCDTHKMGALAAVAAAIKHFEIDDELLILAGDNLLPKLDIPSLIPPSDEVRLALSCVEDLPTARSFGVVELASQSENNWQTVTGFAEKPEQPTSRFVSTGFMGLGRALLPSLVEFSVTSPDALGAVVTHFLEQKVIVKATVVPGDWFDVGSYEAYLAAHKALQKSDLVVEPGSVLENCQCQGKVYVGSGCQIRDSVLIDAVIYPGSRVENCHISQSVLDEDCDLKGVDLSRKLIRARTVLRSP